MEDTPVRSTSLDIADRKQASRASLDVAALGVKAAHVGALEFILTAPLVGDVDAVPPGFG